VTVSDTLGAAQQEEILQARALLRRHNTRADEHAHIHHASHTLVIPQKRLGSTKSTMSGVIGWSRDDLEGPQAVDVSPGGMLHPVNRQSHHQDDPQQTPQVSDMGDDRAQDGREAPIPSSPGKIPSSVTVPVEAHDESGRPGRILGMRRTTFLLTTSNLLLAIALVVLGVVQSQVLKSGSGTSRAIEAQGSCPTSVPSRQLLPAAPGQS
jgi:hypothetical protein